VTEQPKLLARAADLATATAEVERLRLENWQLKGALGYPVPGDIPQGNFKCGMCEPRAKDNARLRKDQEEWSKLAASQEEEIDYLLQQRDRLLAALNLTMLGGNHLANVLIGRLGGGFAAQYPPDLDHEIALRKLGATDEYDVWCCWAAIMTARAAVEKKP
jgi:hypothetical protein